MNNITDIKSAMPEKPATTVWECPCSSTEFEIHGNGSIVCIECERHTPFKALITCL